MKKVKDLEDQQVSLKLECASRPSVKDWRAAKQTIFRLKQKLSDSQGVAELRKHMDTRELIRKDKKTHRLNLHRVELLPNEICVEIIQSQCR